MYIFFPSKPFILFSLLHIFKKNISCRPLLKKHFKHLNVSPQQVGKGIVDNIAESIYKSRRTVCVLSRCYLRSDWCSLELRMATHRLLAEHKHRLILIFFDRISPFELSAFHR